MTGLDFRELLIDERVKFVGLAQALGIAPQTIQSRLHVKKVSLDFVADVERCLGKEPGYFERRYAEKILGKQTSPEAPKQDNTERLIALLEKQSEQIGTLIARIDRLIENK